jgi:hypothetical protein
MEHANQERNMVRSRTERESVSGFMKKGKKKVKEREWDRGSER